MYVGFKNSFKKSLPLTHICIWEAIYYSSLSLFFGHNILETYPPYDGILAELLYLVHTDMNWKRGQY